MNIYLVERTDGPTYGDYRAFVVVAHSESDARDVIPSCGDFTLRRFSKGDGEYGPWPSSQALIDATLIGIAGPEYTETTVLLMDNVGS